MIKLSERDKDLTNTYIREYAGDENVNSNRAAATIDYLLRFWNENKSHYLYKMLNESVILEKSVKYEKPINDIIAELESNDIIRNFRITFLRYFGWGGDAIYLTSYEILARNSYYYEPFTVDLPNDKVLTVPTGCKPMKMIRKICEACGIEGFEDFCLEHSRILNQKMVKGTLCLSIHPLDYLTMSDNDYDWSSCMNWTNQGEFRMGTVEMMNSPCVVIAYLKGEKPFRFYGNYWNNKKWRNLFIVSPDIITGVKGYPYESELFDTEVIKWLKELAETNLNWSYEDDIIAYAPETEYVSIPNKNLNTFCFTTGMMYNDFGNGNHTHCVVSTDLEYGNSYSIHYSGPTECMYCGSKLSDSEDDGEVEDTGCVICSNCAVYHYCNCCGDRINSASDSMYELDDEVYCEECYYDHRCEDPITGEEHYDGNCSNVYLVGNSELDADCPMINMYCPNDLTPDYFKKIHSTYMDTGYWFSSKYCYYVRLDEGTEEGIGLFDLDEDTLAQMRGEISSAEEETASCIF